MKQNGLFYTEGPGYSRNNSAKVQVNQHTGHLNDGQDNPFP